MTDRTILATLSNTSFILRITAEQIRVCDFKALMSKRDVLSSDEYDMAHEHRPLAALSQETCAFEALVQRIHQKDDLLVEPRRTSMCKSEGIGGQQRGADLHRQ